MANTEQHGNKMKKKPKKDSAPSKAGGSDRPMAPTTSVMPKGKEAKKHK
jgi:hypothetical protein